MTRETQFGAYWSAVFTFEADDPRGWIDPLADADEGAHAAARCPGAIDAICLMYTTTKYTKEAMFPHTGTWTLNEFILGAGDATSDNLPPRFAQIQYSWRASDARHPGADLSGAGAECQACGRRAPAAAPRAAG